MNKSSIKITSNVSPEFSSSITVENMTYLVQTEDMGRKASKVITNIYLNGAIIASKKSDYTNLLKLKDSEEKIALMMEKHHKTMIDQFTAEKTKKQKPKADYFSEAQQVMRKGNGRQALAIIREGMELYPSDPFLLSYYGYLIAVVENNIKEGVEICENALGQLDASMPVGGEFYHSFFCLNLGRAYLKDKRKEDATAAFRQGLRNDPQNKDILWELKKLGARREPIFSFLKRSHPVNKKIGLIASKLTRTKQ